MRRPAFIARQSAHPKGCLGGLIGRIMAKETAPDNAQAITLLDLQRGERVLDVGTGHGRSLGVIASAADHVVAVGVDSSDAMLTIAARTNRDLIKGGRVRLEKASSDNLPFDDNSFDAAMAMHTLYFWRPAEPHLKEIARVLRPGGRFVVGFRPAEDRAVTSQFPASVYTFRTTDEVESLLVKAGFVVVADRVRRDDPGDSMVWLKAMRT
jgi:ubiquinone/menaquinone biosynthesis C-methylase UbiE